jgi:hypothetical protein
VPFPPAYPVADFTKPTTAQTRQATIDAQRVNIAALRDMVVATGIMTGWNYQPYGGTPDQPASCIYTRGGEMITVDLTWAAVVGYAAVTKLVFWYSPDAGSLGVTSPAATWYRITKLENPGANAVYITYDGNGDPSNYIWNAP